MSGLQMQAISSVKWTAIRTIFASLTAPLLLIIKARFLSPAEFASLAIVTIFIGLFSTFENFGISQAVIQRDEVEDKEASSLFFFNVLFNCFLGLLLFFSSTIIANIFEIPELAYLLKITSLITILNGPSLLNRALLEKALHFKELSIINMARNTLMLLLTVALLFGGMGVLGVVLGQVISTAFSVILIIITSRKKQIHRIGFYFSMTKVIPFLKFGIFVSAKQIMTYLTHHLDELIIGYFLSREALGLYSFAKSMLEQLRSLITSSFSKVLFPLLSKLKNDAEKLTLAYRKITNYVAFFSFPIFIGIALTAHLFVPLIFGTRWTESIAFFQIFSITLIFLVLTANLSSSLLYSVGRPDIVLYIDVITNIVYLVTLLIFAKYGAMAVMLVYSAYVIYKTLVLQLYTSKHLLYSFLDYIISFKNVFIISSSMIVAVLLLQIPIANMESTLIKLVIAILVGFLVYVAGALVLEKKTLQELKIALLKGRLS